MVFWNNDCGSFHFGYSCKAAGFNGAWLQPDHLSTVHVVRIHAWYRQRYLKLPGFLAEESNNHMSKSGQIWGRALSREEGSNRRLLTIGSVSAGPTSDLAKELLYTTPTIR